MRIRIIVATHKPYRLPQDPLYLPLQGGRASSPPLPCAGDDTGDNISRKNEQYCELTCLYWAWKNLYADYIGLCHYRRYFGGSRMGSRWERILTAPQAERLLRHTPVILPRKRHYWIETNYSQYAHAHHGGDLQTLRAVLAEHHPYYLPAYDRVMARTSGHRFNMFVMRRDLLNAYCTWLFGLLGELERRLDISHYSANDRRVFGFVGERLLDVWLEANHIPYQELPVVHLEKQHWLRKGGSFVRRKLTSGRKGRVQ